MLACVNHELTEDKPGDNCYNVTILSHSGLSPAASYVQRSAFYSNCLGNA